MEEKEIIVLDDIEEEQETRSIREECIELLNLCAADDHFLIALDMDYTVNILDKGPLLRSAY